MATLPSKSIMRLAESLALSITPVSRQRVVAIIYDDSRNIRGIGFCQRKTHPLQKRFSSNENKLYLHAEISALVEAFGARAVFGRGITLPTNIYILRYNMSGVSQRALPCQSCALALQEFGVHNIYESVSLAKV